LSARRLPYVRIERTKPTWERVIRTLLKKRACVAPSEAPWYRVFG